MKKNDKKSDQQIKLVFKREKPVSEWTTIGDGCRWRRAMRGAE